MLSLVQIVRSRDIENGCRLLDWDLCVAIFRMCVQQFEKILFG